MHASVADTPWDAPRVQTQNDTNLGDRLHSRMTAATMLETIYAHQRDQVA